MNLCGFLAQWDFQEYKLPFAAVRETLFILRAAIFAFQDIRFFAFRAGEGEAAWLFQIPYFPWFPAVETLHIAGDQLRFILKHCPGQSSIPIV